MKPTTLATSGIQGTAPDVIAIREYMVGLQKRICDNLALLENAKLPVRSHLTKFNSDSWSRSEGGNGVTCTFANGNVFEKAGVAFTHARGASLPSVATVRHPELTGQPWEALGVSLVVHPRNPHVPTSHANVRFFVANPQGKKKQSPVWWLGGGFDLTPTFGYEDDAAYWHRTAKDALDPFGMDLYPRFKKNCDEYFFLKHRDEARGIGGIFFDDFSELGAEASFAMMRAVGDAYLPAYAPIVERRMDMPYDENEREFQLYRRGRYVEFNLVWDRGTHFGLQSGGRTESILMSMPPLARWDYKRAIEPGSPEARLTDYFLKPRDWVNHTMV